MRPVHSRVPLLLPVLLVSFALGAVPACKKSPPPPSAQAPVAAGKAPAKPAPAKSEAVAEPAKVFAYAPEGFRDPFVSLLQAKAVKSEIPEEKLTPLQRVSVADMRLEGVILMGRKSVAHVVTPDGKAHIVTVGTPMGRNRGKVVRIESDSLVVEEVFTDYQDKQFKQDAVLRLRPKEEEEESL